MSFTKKDHYFPSRISDQLVAQYVSSALQHEHAHISAALKHIEGVTGISAKTASKWRSGKYAPKSRHLLTLAGHYPEVLQAVCELMGMGAIWRHAVKMGTVESMRAQLNERWEKWNKLTIERDKFVHIRVRLDAHKAMKLNQRQLWFLGQLQQGYRMQTFDIADTWRVHIKTARRDVKGLQGSGLIKASKRSGKNWQELV